MKELNSNTKQQRNDRQEKSFYCKPVVIRIDLFADRVLNTGCFATYGSICGSTNPCSNGGNQ